MILTREILDLGKSDRGGWSSKQMVALDNANYKQNKGWKNQIVGKDYDPAAIELFLSLKNHHLSREKINNVKLKKGRIGAVISFEPVFTKIEYSEQYLHPNWQKMRLFVFKRDMFTCVDCGDKTKTLHAHHLKYMYGKFIWEVPPFYIVTLCEDCHSKEHGRDLKAKSK
jgi:hypothetical protein